MHFVESLDNVLNESMMLIQAIEILLRHQPDLKGADLLKERVEAFRRAIFNEPRQQG
jgi:hypothetical protein